MPIETEIRGAVILSAHTGWRGFVGSVGIEGGRITAVRENPLGAPSERVVDGAGHILMPGLVNGHCHGDMTLARGLGDGLTLAEQNTAFGDWFYSLLTDEARIASRQLTYCEALLSGTTFIMENMYWGLGERSAKAMAETGITGALAEDIRHDFKRPDDFLSPAELAAFKAGCKRHGLLPVIGGLSEEDFEEARLLRAAGAARAAGLPLTAHLAETDWRLALVREKYGCGPVEFLARCGVLNEELIASHMVHPTGAEISLLAQAGVKVVNTPLAEAKIADGLAPVPEMLAAGVCVGLGTDGALWNNSNDIFREMKGIALLHSLHAGVRSLSAAQVLGMATVGGQAVFGRGATAGTVEEGKRADLILLDATAPHLTPLRLGRHENAASNVVYCATGADVTDVFVGGARVVQNRKMPGFNLPALCGRVNEISAELAHNLPF